MTGDRAGDRYQGQFVDGEWTGKGKFFQASSGNLYEGEFKKGALKSGKIIQKDGSVYEGELKDWKKNGQGVMTLTNGNVYVGTWEKDQKNGLLTLFKPKE